MHALRSYDSWTDYLLDQLLYGRDSAFARSVAQGSVEVGSPVLRALAHDLDQLQVGGGEGVGGWERVGGKVWCGRV